MSAMDLQAVEFLLSPEGEALIEQAKSLQSSFLTNLTTLRKHYPADAAASALELIELRARAAKKFSHADRMFFTRDALEQSSSEVISNYRARRYRPNSRVLDLACGIGGDTIGLASQCFVTAVDRDPVRIAMARRNLEVYGLADRVTFICADVADVPLEAAAAFLDPSRREKGRRVTSLSRISPGIEFVRRLVDAVPDTAIKLSPGTDYDELESLGGEIEFISESGECKEALVWFGGFSTATRRATVLPAGESMIYEPVGPVLVTEPKAYVHEPEPCVIRAHLVEQLAVRIGATKMDEQIAYLTSDDIADTPFADSYQVLDAVPFNLKEVNRRLRDMDAGRVIVKKRGVPYDPDDIRRGLKLSGSRELVLILTRVSDKPYALICMPAGRPASVSE